ncbi:MAG: autoinducer binding domain-containing protein [Cocleimonas sp.]
MSKDLDKPFIQRLYDSTSMDDKFTSLEREVKLSGFDAVAYTFTPNLSRLAKSLQPIFQFSPLFSELVEYYQENNIQQNDIVMRIIEEGEEDIVDWVKGSRAAMMNTKEEKIKDVIKKNFKVTKGFTFPTLSNDMGYAGVSIISFEEGYTEQEADPAALNHLKDCSKIYHDHIMMHQEARHEFVLPILESLTQKKKAVLRHLVSGKPMKNIAEDSDITPRYAEKLLVELRKEFGGISKNELIYSLGVLNITEYL